MRPKAVVSWSSGKDSAWALHEVRAAGELDVVGLVTTVNDAFSRVAMHGVRRELLEAQARAVGLPLSTVELPHPCSNERYEALFGVALSSLRADGVTHVVFGDLFLRDIRVYREAQLARIGLTPVFPLWGRDTAELAGQMLRAGVHAHVSCLDPKAVPRSLAGCVIDEEFLRALPAGVDPCGERGEFHTFCAAGPMLSAPIEITVGDVVDREGFVFADLKPA